MYAFLHLQLNYSVHVSGIYVGTVYLHTARHSCRIPCSPSLVPSYCRPQDDQATGRKSQVQRALSLLCLPQLSRVLAARTCRLHPIWPLGTDVCSHQTVRARLNRDCSMPILVDTTSYAVRERVTRTTEISSRRLHYSPPLWYKYRLYTHRRPRRRHRRASGIRDLMERSQLQHQYASIFAKPCNLYSRNVMRIRHVTPS